MIQLTNTTACKIRDNLKSLWLNNKIKLHEITNRLCKIELPNWLQSQIIEMCDYRKYERCTCPVEQAMFDAVCYHIVVEITKEV
jgi:hypothetical protein